MDEDITVKFREYRNYADWHQLTNPFSEVVLEKETETTGGLDFENRILKVPKLQAGFYSFETTRFHYFQDGTNLSFYIEEDMSGNLVVRFKDSSTISQLIGVYNGGLYPEKSPIFSGHPNQNAEQHLKLRLYSYATRGDPTQIKLVDRENPTKMLPGKFEIKSYFEISPDTLLTKQTAENHEDFYGDIVWGFYATARAIPMAVIEVIQTEAAPGYKPITEPFRFISFSTTSSEVFDAPPYGEDTYKILTDSEGYAFFRDEQNLGNDTLVVTNQRSYKDLTVDNPWKFHGDPFVTVKAESQDSGRVFYETLSLTLRDEFGNVESWKQGNLTAEGSVTFQEIPTGKYKVSVLPSQRIKGKTGFAEEKTIDLIEEDGPLSFALQGDGYRYLSDTNHKKVSFTIINIPE